MTNRELRIETVAMPVMLLSGLSVGLMLIRNIATGSTDLWFLNWNLLLAWLPLVFAWYLLRTLSANSWLSWKAITLTVLWLLFLPNAFYLVTDFVHLEPNDSVSLMFDIVLLMSYAITGLMLGLLSVYLVHGRLIKRLPNKIINIFLGLVFALCGYALYLGRYLDRNSWDVVSNPFGIMLDTFDRLLYPTRYPGTFTTTLLFFVFLGVCYISFYYTVKLVSNLKH